MKYVDFVYHLFLYLYVIDALNARAQPSRITKPPL